MGANPACKNPPTPVTATYTLHLKTPVQMKPAFTPLTLLDDIIKSQLEETVKSALGPIFKSISVSPGAHKETTVHIESTYVVIVVTQAPAEIKSRRKRSLSFLQTALFQNPLFVKTFLAKVKDRIINKYVERASALGISDTIIASAIDLMNRVFDAAFRLIDQILPVTTTTPKVPESTAAPPNDGSG